MFKLQTCKKEKQNRQWKWIKLIIQSKTNKQNEQNDSAGWKGNHLHTSKKTNKGNSLPKTWEKEIQEIIYTHMYIIQYATMQDSRPWVGAIMAPSTEHPPLDGIYICVKSNAHTKAGTTENYYFQDLGSDSLWVLFNMGVETDTPL